MSILKNRTSVLLAMITFFVSAGVFAGSAAGEVAKSWDMTSSSVG